MRLGDFNGDGKTDIACETSSVSFAAAGTGGFQADLMASAVGSLGGSVQVSYTPSSAFSNVNNPPIKYAVTILTSRDGRTGTPTSTTSFHYVAGMIDRNERQFLGFHYRAEYHPWVSGDTTNPATQTWYSQELASLGKPQRIYYWDETGLLRRRTYITYASSAPGVLPRTSPLVQLEIYAQDEIDQSWRQVRTTYAYDAYGNKTQEFSYGDMSDTADDVYRIWGYAPNLGGYIVDRVAHDEQWDPTTNQQLTAKQFYYDGAGDWNIPPVRGELTTSLVLVKPANRWDSVSYEYDAWGNVTRQFTTPDRWTRTDYDPADHLFSIAVTTAITSTATEPDSYQWDTLCQKPIQINHANGLVTTQQYDSLCRPTRTDTAAGGFVHLYYGYTGNPDLQRVRVETPPSAGMSGNLWKDVYFDGFGRSYLSWERGSDSQSILNHRGFDQRGQQYFEYLPWYSGDPMYHWELYHDGLGRPRRFTKPDGRVVTINHRLWTTTEYDENGKTVVTQHDARGLPIVVERQLNGQPVRTTSEYDRLGRLVRMTDALGNQWTWTYDSLGRVIAKNDPDAGVWTYEYNALGELAAQTDAKGQRTDFQYDLASRVTSKSNSAGLVTYRWSESAGGYFNGGKITTVGIPGASSWLQYDYDRTGQIGRIINVIDGQEYRLEKRFDSAGRLTGVTYPDGQVVGSPGAPLVYDQAGRLRSIPGILNDVAYDAAGRPTTQSNANGTVTTRVYDQYRGWLWSIVTTGAGTIQNTYFEEYDPTGRLKRVTSPVANESWTYAYDDAYRLTSASIMNGTPGESQTFQYDAIGRLTSSSRNGSYTYPSVGQARPHAPTTVGGANHYLYDPNGNMYSSYADQPWGFPNRSLTWDANNLLTQATASGMTMSFSYDGFGQRVKKSSPAGTVMYPFGDEYEVKNGVATKYFSLPGLGVIAKQVGSGSGLSTFWLHTDRLGSIQAITDSTGTAVQRRTYRPYGDRIADTTGHEESLGWIGERNDRDIATGSDGGLTYLHARYYDPMLGTFISPDPIGVAGGLNSYGYGPGDPINGVDRSGLTWRVCVSDGEDGWCFGADVDFPEWPDPYDPRPRGPTRPCGDECGGTPTPPPTATPTPTPGCEDDPACGPGPSNPIPPGNPLGPTGGSGGPILETNPFVGPNPNGVFNAPNPYQVLNGPVNRYFSPPINNWSGRFQRGYGTPLGPTAPGDFEWLNANDRELGDAPEITFVVAGALTGVVQGWRWGYEFSIGRNWRFAPFGNRTGHPLGRWPHYHHRIVGPDGKTVPGGGIGRHRPWE